jgi:hypothetical protein
LNEDNQSNRMKIDDWSGESSFVNGCGPSLTKNMKNYSSFSLLSSSSSSPLMNETNRQRNINTNSNNTNNTNNTNNNLNTIDRKLNNDNRTCSSLERSFSSIHEMEMESSKFDEERGELRQCFCGLPAIVKVAGPSSTQQHTHSLIHSPLICPLSSLNIYMHAPTIGNRTD